MAFGKKSFLIRDILESHSQNMSTSNSNSLIDWIISNRVHYFSQGLTSTANNQIDNDTNADAQPLAGDPPEQDSLNANLALNPLFQNWLSFHRLNSFSTGWLFILSKILFYLLIFFLNFSIIKSTAYCNFFTK